MQKSDIGKGITQALGKAPEGRFVRRVKLFGSHLRDEAHGGSDVDLLVEFSTPIGLFAFVGLQRTLEETLGCHVDLVTPNALSKYI